MDDGADAQAVELDDVAGVEGVVGVVDEVLGVGCEVLIPTLQLAREQERV